MIDHAITTPNVPCLRVRDRRVTARPNASACDSVRSGRSSARLAVSSTARNRRRRAPRRSPTRGASGSPMDASRAHPGRVLPRRACPRVRARWTAPSRHYVPNHGRAAGAVSGDARCRSARRGGFSRSRPCRRRRAGLTAPARCWSRGRRLLRSAASARRGRPGGGGRASGAATSCGRRAVPSWRAPTRGAPRWRRVGRRSPGRVRTS
jgi:hypothetical protein